MHRAQFPASLFKGDPLGLVGDLGMGRDTCQGETAGQALSNSLLKSTVTPAAVSFREAGKGRTGPDAFEM